MGEKNKSPKHTRIRQYAVNYRGEIIVFIHANSDKFRTKSITKGLFDKYRHITHITLVNKNKLKVLFGEKENRAAAIAEANSLAKCSIDDCIVYIPAKYCEVQGVVSWPVKESIEDFSYGKGKFRNSLLKEIKVLESTRLMRKSNVASSEQILENTSIVIITFEGNLLPDTLEVDKMLIPVREYRRRAMYCENCKLLGHSQSRCAKKKLENPTYLCMQCKCNDHLGGSTQCPRRKIIEKKELMTMRKLRNAQGTRPNWECSRNPSCTYNSSIHFSNTKRGGSAKTSQKCTTTSATSSRTKTIESSKAFNIINQ